MMFDPYDLHEEFAGRILIGVDEVGTGSLVGPVAACAAIIDPTDPYVREHARDSKQYTGTRARDHRRTDALEFKRRARLHVVMPGDVIGTNTRAAADRAMAAAVLWVAAGWQACYGKGELLVVVDGESKLPLDGLLPQRGFIKGDQRFLVIAAASTIAKDWRDELVMRLATSYPGYGIERHMGYATREHLEALKRLGPSPIHRKDIVDATMRRHA